MLKTGGFTAFNTLQRTRFISEDEVREELFSADGQILLNDKEIIKSRLYIKEYESFCRKNAGDLELVIEDMKSFLKTLSEKEQEEFALSYFVFVKKQILVDLKTKQIRTTNEADSVSDEFRNQDIKFADYGRDIVIKDKRETKIVITPTGQSGKFSWKVLEYHYPENYVKHSLYPVIAYKKDKSGKRTFLTQQEAMRYVEELGLLEGKRPDVKLGEILAAYFAPEITKYWKKAMTLEPLERDLSRRDFQQPMMGAQMPAWVAVEHHRRQLLSDENPFFVALEKHADSVL